MPSPDNILEQIGAVRSLHDKAWTGQDHGVSFYVGRVGLQGLTEEETDNSEILFLRIQGRKRGRERLALDFTDALGKPWEKTSSRGRTFVTWVNGVYSDPNPNPIPQLQKLGRTGFRLTF